MSSKIVVDEIMPGCKVAKVGGTEVMFGCPSEVLKLFSRQSRQMPKIIVLPDEFYRFGVIQAALEFVLYDFLFVQGRFFAGEKLTIVSTEEQVNRMEEILELTLLGPSRWQMELWDIPPDIIEDTVNLSHHFALKHPGTDRVAAIADMINFVAFNHDFAEPDGQNIFIGHGGANIFSVSDGVNSDRVDINLHEMQAPPIDIPVPLTLTPHAVFGATAISQCTTGFDPNGYTSGILIHVNGLIISADGVAWMKPHLQNLGINPAEISAHIITHIHDDHSNIFDLIVNGEKFHLLADKLVYHCVVRKAALLLNLSEDKVASFIHWIEYKLNKPLEWYGAVFEFWPTAHPIPTRGFKVTVSGHSIIYSGDTCWGSQLAVLVGKGVIRADFAQKLNDVPNQDADVIFHDAGGGFVHPLIHELAALPPQIRRHIVPTHLPKLPHDLVGVFELIHTGQNWILLPQKSYETSTFTQIRRAPLLVTLSPEWRSVMLSQGTVQEYPPGYMLLREGTPGKNFYLLLGGTVQVLQANEQVALLSTGDFFGEISLMSGSVCNASIITRSPVKVLELPRHIFLAMVQATGLAAKLEKIHKVRPIYMQFSLMKNLPAAVQNRLFEVTNMETWLAGTVIIREGDVGDKVYGIIGGHAEVIHLDLLGVRHKLADLHPGQIFGEMAFFGDGHRTADVAAVTDMTGFSIDRVSFEEIIENVPMLKYGLGKLAESRK
ncbi:TPA: hypothetical protein DF272_03120 [Candidatus Falkowbacteria bacterium]|nr:hypothetical protein [Candidatus Falkowbacteria bacterium]